VHRCWLDVAEDRIDIFEAEQQLVDLLAEPPIYPRWLRVLFAFAIGLVIAPLGASSQRCELTVQASAARWSTAAWRASSRLRSQRLTSTPPPKCRS